MQRRRATGQNIETGEERIQNGTRNEIKSRYHVSTVGRTNHSKSGPNDPTFFSWMGVHALMAVRTLTLSLVKYLRDAVDFCETAQLPL